MDIETRFDYIKRQYGKEAETMWREIAKLPNFNTQYLINDKMFLCITNKGFMARAGYLGFGNNSFYDAIPNGIGTYKVKEKNSLWNENKTKHFSVGIDEKGSLFFDCESKEFLEDGFSPKQLEHERENFRFDESGNIIYSNESSMTQYLNNNIQRIIKTKSTSSYDKDTGIKYFEQTSNSEQRNNGKQIESFTSHLKSAELNSDFATVSTTESTANLVNGELVKNNSSQSTLYPGDYIPMDDFGMTSFLEQQGEKIELGTPEAEEKINEHRIKLAEGGLKNIGKLPIQLIEQLPTDIQRNISGYKEIIHQPNLSVSAYSMIYEAIMQHKNGPDKMSKMTKGIKESLGQQKETDIGQSLE